MTEHWAPDAVASIFLIGDGGENLTALANVLRTHGYGVHPVRDAVTALASASSEPPDLILLDRHLPGMDAYEVCRCLRAEPRTAGIPIIVLSTSGQCFDKVQAFEAGAADCLSRPFENAEMLVRIEAQIRLRRLQARVEAQNHALQTEIFERKRAEEALRQFSRQVEGLVTERTEDLIRSEQELRREIQGRIAVEEIQRESEAKYRRLHQSLRDAIVNVDLTGRVQDANPAFQAMLGYTLDELRHLSYVELTPSCWHASETRIVDEQILSRGFSDSYEKEYLRRDGTVCPVELRAFLRTNLAGVPDGMCAIVRDITERKRAQAHSAAALEQEEALRHTVDHRSRKRRPVVSALLGVRCLNTADPAGLAVGAEDLSHPRTMASVRQPLFGAASLADVAFDRFLARLLSHIDKQHVLAGVVIRSAFAQVTLGIGTALPCGLIVNALVAHAMQRAFPDGRGGHVDVELASAKDGVVCVTVSDDGVGLPADFSIDRQSSMAWQLIVNLTRQIDGTLVVVPVERTCFALSFRTEPRVRLGLAASPDPLHGEAEQ